MQADASVTLIDDKTKRVFCRKRRQSGGKYLRHRALAAVAHKHGVPLIVDNTVATPILLKPIDYGATSSFTR